MESTAGMKKSSKRPLTVARAYRPPGFAIPSEEVNIKYYQQTYFTNKYYEIQHILQKYTKLEKVQWYSNYFKTLASSFSAPTQASTHSARHQSRASAASAAAAAAAAAAARNTYQLVQLINRGAGSLNRSSLSMSLWPRHGIQACNTTCRCATRRAGVQHAVQTCRDPSMYRRSQE